MQRSRQEIVDDGRRHCYLTPPLHVLPGALLWILGDTQKSRLKWVVTRMCYMRKARRSCQGVQGQKIPCHLFIYIVPYCVYVFIWSTLIRWVHIWVFCSVFLGGFFLLTRHFQQFMLYHRIGATSLSQFYGFYTGKKPKDVTLQKMGVEMKYHASMSQDSSFSLFSITFWILTPNVNFYANAEV